jgi:NIPSNAP
VTQLGEKGPPVIDIRTYRLVPGGRSEFERLFTVGALPMLRRDGIDVVAHGFSLDDDDHFWLVRAFPSASRRREQLDAFYGSEEWRKRYRDAVLALIETYHVVAVELTPATHEGLRSLLS